MPTSHSTFAKGNKPQIEKIASVGTNESLEKHIRRDDWNDYVVIARGNVFMHIINGHVMSIGIDEDQLNARESGVIAWQLHAGPPLKIEMKKLVKVAIPFGFGGLVDGFFGLIVVATILSSESV